MTLTWYGDDGVWRPYLIVQVGDSTYVEIVKVDDHHVWIYLGHKPPEPLGMYHRYGVPGARLVRKVTVDDDDWEMIESDPETWVISHIL